MGDLTWNYEQKLVCPNNLIGKVDLYQDDASRPLDRSNSPQFVWGDSAEGRGDEQWSAPKGRNPSSVFENSQEVAWHRGTSGKYTWPLAIPKEVNTDEKMIANSEPNRGSAKGIC